MVGLGLMLRLILLGKEGGTNHKAKLHLLKPRLPQKCPLISILRRLTMSKAHKRNFSLTKVRRRS